jgi:hypothetical protein
LPALLGLRTRLDRWVSTERATRDPSEIDSQADCVGSQLEQLSNKLEPPETLSVTCWFDSTPENLERRGGIVVEPPAPQPALLEVELDRHGLGIADLAAVAPHVLHVGEHEHALPRDVDLVDAVAALEVVVGPARPVARLGGAAADTTRGVDLDIGMDTGRESIDVAVAQRFEHVAGKAARRRPPIVRWGLVHRQ